MSNIYCENCGESMLKTVAFCPNCGTPVQKENLATEARQAKTTTEKAETTQTSSPQRNSKQHSKKSKVGLIITLSAVLLLVAAHFTINYLVDSDRQIKNIYNAIIDEDEQALFNELEVSEDLIHNKKSYTAALKDMDLHHLQQDLTGAAERTKQSGLIEVLSDGYGNELFRIKKEDFLYLYKKIAIEPINTSLTIHTDLADATLKIEDHEIVLKGEKVELDQILPGDYTITLEGENEFFASSEKFNLTAEELRSGELNLAKDDYTVTFVNDQPDGILFINDKSTEKKIEEIGKISPVFDNGTVFYAVRTLDKDKTEKSDELQAVGGEAILFNYPSIAKAEAKKKAEKELEAAKKQQSELDQRIINQAAIFYKNFRESYETALNYQDFNFIEGYLDSRGPAYLELKDFIADSGSQYYDYTFHSNDVESGEVKGDKVHLHVRERFVFENHLGKRTNYDRRKEYVLKEVGTSQYTIMQINIEDTHKN